MKQLIHTALIAAVVVLFSTSMAFATTQKVHTVVPFPFLVDNTVMPAGTYTIFPVTYNEIEVSGDHATALTSVIQATPGNNTSLKGSLAFDKFGGRYVLRGVVCDYAGINVEIPATSREKAARAGLAKSGQRSQQVSVAAR